MNLRDVLRGIGWRQVRAAMLLGLAISAWNLLVVAQAIVKALQTMPWWHLLEAVIGDQIRAFCLVVAIAIADRRVDEGESRVRTYTLAVCWGGLAGYLASQPFHWGWRLWVLPDPWPKAWFWLNGATGHLFWSIAWLLQWLPVAAPVVFLHANRRAARRTARLLHDAELDRIRRSKLALESRLQAMQARVEPRFLLNTLALVAALYRTDAPLAGRTLDDLIAYLRAAMPHMRDTSSNLAREVDLARAYLDIVRMRLGDRLDVSFDVPSGAGATRMPPMMLLPLVDRALGSGLERASAAAAISIAAEVGGGRLRLSVLDSGLAEAAGAESDGVSQIRQRLDALYPGEATLELRRAGDRATEAVLELPVEPVAPADAAMPAA